MSAGSSEPQVRSRTDQVRARRAIINSGSRGRDCSIGGREAPAMRRVSSIRRRRAAALMMALVVLLIVGLVSGLALRAILQSYRQTREEGQRLQAELLADAALNRAELMLQR